MTLRLKCHWWDSRQIPTLILTLLWATVVTCKQVRADACVSQSGVEQARSAGVPGCSSTWASEHGGCHPWGKALGHTIIRFRPTFYLCSFCNSVCHFMRNYNNKPLNYYLGKILPVGNRFSFNILMFVLSSCFVGTYEALVFS